MNTLANSGIMMAMSLQFIVSIEPAAGDAYGADAFADQIGKLFPLQLGDLGEVSGTLRSATVLPGGGSAQLTIEIDALPMSAGHPMAVTPNRAVLTGAPPGMEVKESPAITLEQAARIAGARIVTPETPADA